jgi:hypothetical protein
MYCISCCLFYHITAEKSHRDFIRNNQTELKCETEAADCNAQTDIKKVYILALYLTRLTHALLCIRIPGVLCT